MKTRLLLMTMTIALSAVCDSQFASIPQRFVDKTLSAPTQSRHTKNRLAYARREKAKMMKLPYPNIVEGKKVMGDSGDPHDYMSFGPYWWPNPDTPNGLPYIRKDGVINPTYKDGDNVAANAMYKRISILAPLWFFDKDEEAAASAVAQLKCFFLDEATRMNPNLNYGQSIPGITKGRAAGLIETYTFLSDLVDSIIMLKTAPAMTPETYAALMEWFRQFNQWFHETRIGQDELKAPNNHGLAAFVQTARYYFLTGDLEKAREAIRNGGELICRSVAPDGSLPAELIRTKSFGYSVYAAGMMTQLALMGDNIGVNLMEPGTKSADDIRRAVLFLCSFIEKPEEWKHQQIHTLDPNGLANHLVRLYAVTEDPIYLENLRKLTKCNFSYMEELFIIPEF